MKKQKAVTGKVIYFPTRHAPQYPNAADSKYLMEKVVNYALTLATATGIVSVVYFLALI